MSKQKSVAWRVDLAGLTLRLLGISRNLILLRYMNIFYTVIRKVMIRQALYESYGGKAMFNPPLIFLANRFF